MSLDITIMDEFGTPQECVSLTVDEHWIFVQRAQSNGLILWNRMADYYEDTEYQKEEIQQFVRETEQLQALFSEVNISSKLKKITDLLQLAITRQNRVSVIAD